MRAARKPSAVARELLRNFPKAGGRRRRRKRKGGGSQQGGGSEKNGARAEANGEHTDEHDVEELDVAEDENGSAPNGDEELEAAEVAEDLEAAEAADES